MDYNKIYLKIIENAKDRVLEGYFEIHHILPRCLGGLDIEENLIKLTAKEHFLCHRLLCEIYPENNKLKHALFLMAIGKQRKTERYYISGKVYERLKTEYSNFLRGKSQSDETKNKKSIKMEEVWGSKTQTEMSNIGKKRAQSRKENNSEWHSEEWKAKVSQSLKGRDNSKANTSRSKPVLQLDLEENFIKRWDSIALASRQLKCDINGYLHGRQKTAGGYKWRYE